uniref:RanBD1 domain-containing protein n=1 Tax=Hyaloperonospora arabidopsidis (strain Emoy2) TaxID=559515 RepID=M4BXI6_HYAAE
MAKRRNENGQMRREEYEAAEDGESADSFDIGFQRASEESIRKRKIVKARVGSRPPAAATARACEAEKDTVKSNAFGGFQGLTTAKSAVANPFAGFSGLSGTSSKPATVKTGGACSSGQAAASSGSHQQAMENLNKAFLRFVNSQLQTHPSVSWVDAVQDYLKYAAEIDTKHATTKPGAVSEAKPPSTAIAQPAVSASSASLSFGESSAAANKKDDSTKALTSTGFAFGGAIKKEDKPAESIPKEVSGSSGGSSSLFSAQSSAGEEKTTPAFSFGALTKPAVPVASSTPATGGFAFGNMTAATSAVSASSDGLTFGLSVPAASTSTSATVEEENEENIGREEATVIIKADSPDDDCTFEADKAKIFEFKKDEKRWADKGVHPLKVLVSKESKSARILARNAIGKVVLNSALYKGMSVQPHTETTGKKTGVYLALQGDSSDLTRFLIKVNVTRIDELVKALEIAVASL